MIGAIIGDIVGSIYEFHNIKSKEFDFFDKRMAYTDDSILTIATADWLLGGGSPGDYYLRYANEYPHPMGSYGPGFVNWVRRANHGIMMPYNSCGNGSAMRVSPVGWAFADEESTLDAAKRSAECTHNHPEGVKGACSVAAAIFLARQGQSQKEIRRYLQRAYGYDLDKSLDEIGNTGFDVTCQGSVPQAIVCALETSSVEEAVRSAILLRGDADTQGAIAGSIAEALWGVPEDLFAEAARRLDRFLLDGLGRWLAWLGEGQHSLAQ